MAYNGESQSTLARGARRILTRGALLVALVAIVGVLVGHFVWSAASTLQVSPAFNGSSGPFGFSRPAEGSGPYRGPYGYGGGSSGAGGGEGEGANGSSGSSSGVSSSITAKVDPALVDIDTVLGLEGDEAAGTGMVITSAGEVITNNHVIAGATKITATDLGNGTTYTARVVGYDYGQDIAVLQLEGASGLKTVKIGDSTSAKVGQSIVTIGNAGGAGGTPAAAAGQISALDQSITAGEEVDGGQEHLSGLIQLEGDVQPGDSGGPLVNSSGEVLGMDTAASATFQFRSSADQGFAIPIDQVQTIAGQILAGRSSSTIHIGATGLLGVFVESQSSGEGALVENVISGTPAASCGLTAGDVITAIDGAGISSPTALTEAMLLRHPGDSVQITWHTPEGVQHTASVTLASGPPQ